MRSSVIVLVLSLAWVGSVRGQSLRDVMRGASDYKGNRQYQAAYQKGRAEADQQLKDQCATIYTLGFGVWPAAGLDRGTGLPCSLLGCMMSDEILGRVDGHNDRIRESIKEHGYPKYSYKPWEKELFGLKAYTESRRKLVRPETLKVDGPAWKSPDGSCTVRVVVKDAKGPNGEVTKDTWLETRARGRPPQDVYLLAEGNDTFELVPGPDGSGLAVLAWKGYRGRYFEAIDLKRGRGLRIEPDVLSDDKPGDRPGGR